MGARIYGPSGEGKSLRINTCLTFFGGSMLERTKPLTWEGPVPMSFAICVVRSGTRQSR